MLDWVSLLNTAGERISKEEFLKLRKKVKVEEKPKVLWKKTLNLLYLYTHLIRSEERRVGKEC